MTGPARIRLCGPLAVDLGDGPRERRLPGRQGRLLVAYLAANRTRAVRRDELVELLWPERLPADPGESLSSLLSKVRAVLGPDALAGRSELRLVAPAWVDIEAAAAAVADAEADPARAWDAAGAALAILDQGFLPGEDGHWAAARRSELDALRLRALDCLAVAGTRRGQAPEAERAARALVAAAPFGERAHVLLMEALAAGGNVGEALRVYEALRGRLRDELGAVPGAGARELHARLLGEAPPAARAERKLITVLVAELAASATDPEQLHATLAGAREAARGAIERHGGTVHRALGTLVVAVFGAPTAHEDDAARALRAAREIVARAGRAGVAGGEALVLAAGLVEGEAFTRALALQQAAGAGEVAWDAPSARALMPFVGRAHELERLRAAFAAGGLLAIVGEAGVGKTRLATTFARTLEATVLSGRCLPYGRGITWWPLREALWDAAGIALDDPAAVAAAKLRRLAGRDERVAEALAITAGITLEGSRLERAPPATVAAEIERAWPLLLSTLAAGGPLVLLVDDVHLAEPPLLDMLELLVARTTGRLLVLVTARAARRPDWPVLELGPLAPAEAGTLAAQLLPAADAAVRERVTAHAEGNPFFLEQLAHHVADAGAPPATLPASVRALLAARLDALDAEAKRTLQDAAVVGRTFWASTLEAMRPGAAVRAALSAAQERGFVTTRPGSSLPGQTELAFRHGLIREVAYRSLPLAERAAAHAAVAGWLDGLAGERRAGFVELLAYHYEAAATPWPGGDDPPEELRAAAVAALLAAGQAAHARLTTPQALEFSARALALARAGPERLAALELRAVALHAAARGSEALAAYRAAIDAAPDAPDARRLRALAVLVCSRYAGTLAGPAERATAIAMIEQGLREADLDALTFEAGALLVGRAFGLRRFGRSPSAAGRRDAARAVEIAEAIGSGYLLANALEALTWLTLNDEFGAARELGERLVASADRIPDRDEAHEGIAFGAICLAWAGARAQALAAAARAQHAAAGLGPHRALHAAAAQTFALLSAGRIDELRVATADVLELVDADGGLLCATAAVGLAGQALASFEAGDDATARRVVDVLDDAWPTLHGSVYRSRILEFLLPFLPVADTRARLAALVGVDTPGEVGIARAALTLALHTGDPDPPVAPAHALAERAQVPALSALADLAAAPDTAAALAAADALAEPYTAARALAARLGHLRAPAGRAEAARRLQALGAHTSARRAIAAYSPPS